MRSVQDLEHWTEIVPYGTPVSVAATLTTLLAFTDYGSDWRALKVFLSNEDAVNPGTLIVDVSHGGTQKVGDMTQTREAGALEEATVDLGDPQPFTYIRIAANSGSTIAVRWALLGLRRTRP